MKREVKLFGLKCGGLAIMQVLALAFVLIMLGLPIVGGLLANQLWGAAMGIAMGVFLYVGLIVVGSMLVEVE